MPETNYPSVRTVYSEAIRSHPNIVVQYAADAEPQTFCGESWCAGGCGLPALVIPATEALRERKAYSSMVACGPMMQPWRVTWKGTRVEVPEEHHAWFEKGMWW